MAIQLSKSLRIGVMAEEIQLADIMGMDILASLAKPDVDAAAITQKLPGLTPMLEVMAGYADHFVEIEWFFISSTLDPASTSTKFKWLPNMTYDDCPRDLDIVLTGGPWPTHRPAKADKFIREAWPKVRFWLTTCIGSMWIADSGVLDGKQAATNRDFLPAAREANPAVEWLEQRWVVQGKEFEGEGVSEVWTSAGAGAGIDMIVAFCFDKFDRGFVKDVVLPVLEVQPDRKLGQFY